MSTNNPGKKNDGVNRRRSHIERGRQRRGKHVAQENLRALLDRKDQVRQYWQGLTDEYPEGAT